MVLPPLFAFLLNTYGLKGALLIWSSLCLQMSICALLLRPTEFYTRLTKSNRSRSEDQGQQCEVTEEKNGDVKPSDEINGEEQKLKDNLHTTPESTDNPRRHYNLELFKNREFLVYCASMFLVMTGAWNVLILVIPASGSNAGFTKSECSLLVALIGAGDIVGRPLMGILADRKFVANRMLFMFNFCLASVITIIIPHTSSNYIVLAFFSVCIGLLIGPYITMAPSILSEVVSKEKFTTAVGWMAFFMGSPSLFTQSLTSKLYSPAFFLLFFLLYIN